MRTKGDWFQFATVNLEWVNPRMTLDVPHYVDNLLATMEQIDANALVYDDSGGWTQNNEELLMHIARLKAYEGLLIDISG